jgi:hypothetical protein
MTLDFNPQFSYIEDMKITFDIETIPQRAPLGPVAQKALENKLAWQKNRNEEDDPDESVRRTMGTSPYLGEIITIGYQIGNQTPIALIGPEETILKDFWKVLETFEGVFVSYNGIKFDVPFIIRRGMYYGITPTNKNFLNLKRFSFYPHFDVYQALSDWGQPNLTLSLDQACEFFGIRSSKIDGIKASQVAQAFTEGRIKEIAEYCKRDVVATAQIFELLAPYYYNLKN